MRPKSPTAVFVPEKFGQYLREKRRKAGFSSAPKFSESIKEKTGIYIDHETIHKIERGEREPDITKLIAMCFAIKPTNYLGVLDDLIVSSHPADFYFLDGTNEEKEYIEAYRRRFNSEPTVEHVLSVFDIVQSKDNEIEGTTEEKVFGNAFRAAYKLEEKYSHQLTKDLEEIEKNKTPN